MIDRLRSFLSKRVTDDRSMLLAAAATIAAGGKGADRLDPGAIDATLRRLDMTPADLDSLVELQRERSEAAAAAEPFDELRAAAAAALRELTAATDARLAALRHHDAKVADARRSLTVAEQLMHAAAEARDRLLVIDRRLRLAAGADPDLDRRIVRLPGEIANVREREPVLRAELATARTRLERAELAIERDRTSGGELIGNERANAHSDVVRLEAELAALPGVIASKELELSNLQGATQ